MSSIMFTIRAPGNRRYDSPSIDHKVFAVKCRDNITCRKQQVSQEIFDTLLLVISNLQSSAF